MMMIKEEIIHHLWDLRFMIFYGGKSFEKRFEKDFSDLKFPKA